MTKLVGVLSISLWAAALTFSPSPAQAYAKYPSLVSYFACSTYQAINPYSCIVDYETGERAQFVAKMDNTIPISACAGSCNGTVDLHVSYNTSNGRKTATDMGIQCGGQYLLELGTCNNCS